MIVLCTGKGIQDIYYVYCTFYRYRTSIDLFILFKNTFFASNSEFNFFDCSCSSVQALGVKLWREG